MSSPDRRARARVIVPAAIPFLLALVLLAPAILGGKVMSASDVVLFSPPFPPQPPGAVPENPMQFDSAYVFEPDGLMVREALRDGRLPLWAPELGAGWPLLATQQSAPLYPLNWISVLFPYWESLAWIALLKLGLAGLGAFLLGRALGLRRGPALLGGVAFAFGTYMVVWLMHPHVNAYVLLPWLFLLGERLAHSGAVRDAAAFAGVLGIAFLGGHPASGLIVTLAAAGWIAYRIAAFGLTRSAAARRAGLAAAAGLLGAAIGAVMLVPLFEALGQSWNYSRSQPPLPIRSGLSLFFPEYWGRADRGPDLGPLNFTERTIYAGAVPTILAVAGLAARRPTGPQFFFAGLALLGLLLALDTGPIASVAGSLPVLDQIQLHRVLVLVLFGIAMLGAFGLQRLLDATPAERRRMLVAGAVTALLPALVVLVVNLSALDELGGAVKRLVGVTSPASNDALILQSLLRWLLPALAAVGLLAFALGRRRAPALLAAVALSITAIDLLAMGWGYNPAIPKAEADPPAPPPVEAMRRLSAGGERVTGIGGLVPNTASRWGLLDARGHEQPVVERTTLLWFGLGGVAGDGTVAVNPQDPKSRLLLDVFGVRAVLTAPAAGPLPPGLRGSRVAFSGPGGNVLERAAPLPPAFVAYSWRPSAGLDESILHVGLGSAEQARDQPAVETDAQPPPGPPLPATPGRVVERSDTEVVIEVEARRAGQLVLLDTFYPGWEAKVDGEDAEIRPANGAFRAVPVDAGRHEVRFDYRPASVTAGGITTVAALVVVLAGLGSPRLRRRQSSRNDSSRSTS